MPLSGAGLLPVLSQVSNSEQQALEDLVPYSISGCRGPEGETGFRLVHPEDASGLSRTSDRRNRLLGLARTKGLQKTSSLGGTTATDVVARAYV